MKPTSLVVFFAGVLAAQSVLADDLALLEKCIDLSDALGNASVVFGAGHHNSERAELMASISPELKIEKRIVEIAGGAVSKAVLANFEADKKAAIVGDIFAVPLPIEVAQCTTQGGQDYDCKPISSLLENSSELLAAACEKDYLKVKN